jgi:hypothetical protein
MKKFILGASIFILVFSSIIYLKITYFPEPYELDVFENMEIAYIGSQGNGNAEIDENYISYNGRKKEILDFIKNIDYTITPNENLKNYDEITVTVNVDKETLKKLNIKLRKSSKTFRVRGLEKNTDTKKAPIEMKDVNGFNIPTNWNLSKEDEQAYISYLQQMKEKGNAEIATKDVQFEWQQGTGIETKENADFFIKDYMNIGTFAYEYANNYGMTSNQEFKIVPLVEKEETIGYSCIFKDMN